MPNICTNRVIVIGPAEAISSFLAAAKGPVSDPAHGAFQTELRIVEEVRAGKPVHEAFRDANLRLDALNHGLTTLPLEYEMSSDPVLRAVPDEEFETWAQEIAESAEREIAREKDDLSAESHLSLTALVPMPESVARESWHLAGHQWRMSEWGCKWMDAVREPTLHDIPSFSESFGMDIDGEAGDTIAVYPKFDTPNSPVFAGLLNASRNHRELLFLSGFMDPDCSEYRYYAAKNGEELAFGSIDEDDLPKSCFDNHAEEGGEPEMYVSETDTLNYLTETASLEAYMPSKTAGSSRLS